MERPPYIRVGNNVYRLAEGDYTLAAEDVDVSSDEVISLLEVGQAVDTPLGAGKIVDIAIHAGKYGDKIEIEPPSVTVELNDPKEGDPKRVQVCMCKLGLEDAEKEAIISKEFSRLWPPLTDEIPQDTRMLVDVKEEFASLQRSAYSDYAEITTEFGNKTAATVDNLQPGMVVTDLEGVDLGDENAVVLKMDEDGERSKEGGNLRLVLYLPDSDTTKVVNVPTSYSYTGYDSDDLEVPTPTVYDPVRLDSPSLHTIRVLPDTYLPKNPNYPSTITDTVWRPTVRQTPIRFYSTDEPMSDNKDKSAAFSHKPEQGPGTQNYWPPEDYVNYPTPDFVPHPEDMLPYESGPHVYDIGVEAVKEFKHDQKKEDLALEFYREYVLKQQKKLMGRPSHLNLSVSEFAEMFAKDPKHPLSEEALVDLFVYMVEIGLFQKSTLDLFLDHIDTYRTERPFRTEYPES